MHSNHLRRLFLDYFARRGHTVVPSASLVPGDDPTLLFTNAGMVPFKDVFTGRERRSYRRATSAQKCVRAGGKHNDLENVGYTARHHTFFEMLGNFSFGDYFKEEAIAFAWEFVTGGDWLAVPSDRLLVTVYRDDDEAFAVWRRKIGLPESRIVRIGDKPGGGSDNFWQMGETGPCGPCTEIFYDHGPSVAGSPPGSADADGDRWVEIWNLVFMQYDRGPDGSLSPLPAPSVDTGMGLERIAAVKQGVHDNYRIDLFRTLMHVAAEVTASPEDGNPSLKVISDHIRASAFLICDGVLPSNEGRGYVLRRIIRRAVRHGYKLGANPPFFWKLVAPLATVMGEAYPELNDKRQFVEATLRNEETAFAETLAKGMRLLESAIAGARGGVIDGATVFKLYDTYGFPVDLTADIVRERGLRIDQLGYEREMAAQRARARAASGFSADYSSAAGLDARSEFSGYRTLCDESRVTALLVDGQPVQGIEAGQSAAVVLERTPFYAESGGQVGDTGILRGDGCRFEVTDTRKIGAVPGHFGRLVSGSLALGDRLHAEVDAERRQAIRRNHSATHLLHAALRRVLGEQVQQKGSLVAPDRLRFDFSYSQPMTAAQIAEVEDLVNRQVLANIAAEVRETGYQEAVAGGALALFGEKYGETVRVLRFGDFSMELCGGTHVDRTGDIGAFKIVAESGVAAGVRRVEAVTGLGALDYLRSLEAAVDGACARLRAGRDELLERLDQLLERNRQQEKELARLSAQLSAGQGEALVERARRVGGAAVLAEPVDAADAAALRQLLDQLKNRLGSAVIVLATTAGDKVTLVAGVTEDLTARVKAGDLVNAVARQIGGRGGGRADMAQAGGSDPAALPAALASVYDWVAQRLNA